VYIFLEIILLRSIITCSEKASPKKNIFLPKKGIFVPKIVLMSATENTMAAYCIWSDVVRNAVAWRSSVDKVQGVMQGDACSAARL